MSRRFSWALACLILWGCDSSPPDPAVAAKPTAGPETTATAATVASPTASASSTVPAAAKVPARPLYYAREITDEDLKARSLRELSLMRNTIYARAGNSFRRPWLKAYFAAQPWYAPQEKMDATKLTALDEKNAKKIADHDAAITKAELEASRDQVLTRKTSGQATPEDEVEISLLSQRLGTWLGDEGADTNALENPARLDDLLTVEQLNQLSRRDLRILRNTVYARHGLRFQSKVVKGYFATAAWYAPKHGDVDHMLTKVDRKNIAMIRSVEDTLGGPLHENPNYGREGWFFAA